MLLKARAKRFHLKRDYKLMIVQRDCGELTSNNFMHQLALEEVHSNITTPYTLKQDGVAEMSNGIIVNDANAMMKCLNCPKFFWVTEMKYAVYCRVCTMSKAIPRAFIDHEVTPYKLLFSQKPNI